MLTSLSILFLGISVILLAFQIYRQKERLDYLESYLEDTERTIIKLDRDINQRVDRELEDTHQTFRDVEIDLRSQLDSRLDKLTNQLLKKIPPTNEELMKRIEKIEEESYRLRMNL